MTRFESLERWTATAFLLAGVLFLGFVARNAVLAFGGGLSSQATQALYIAFVVPAELAAYVGLLGLYPRLADRVPKTAGLGAALAVLAAVAVSGFAASATLDLLAGRTEPTAASQIFYLVTLLATILGFIVYAVATLRSGVPGHRVGLLLVVPPATYLVMMGGAAAGVTPEWSTFALSATQAVAHLGIGLVLRSGSGVGVGVEGGVDSAAR